MTIALLTDFGTKDYFVGAMKGVILSIDETAKIVDITHEIEPQNIRAASFTLRACYKNFPQRTIFVAVIDPGVGSERRAILLETEKYFFIAPDNGLLSFIFNSAEQFRVFEITNENFFNHPKSNTFHGRDIFAPGAAHLSKGVSPIEFGKEIKQFVQINEKTPQRIDEKLIEAEILHADRFGNLITNLTENDLPRSFSMEINDRNIIELREYFSAAEKDELFMIWGSAGYLEIAAFQKSAQELLNVKIGDKIRVIIED